MVAAHLLVKTLWFAGVGIAMPLSASLAVTVPAPALACLEGLRGGLGVPPALSPGGDRVGGSGKACGPSCAVALPGRVLPALLPLKSRGELSAVVWEDLWGVWLPAWGRGQLLVN